MLITEARRKKIFELVETEGIINLQRLTEIFQVSIYTIRRDLNALEEKGLIKKTHGGAVRIEKSKWLPSIEDGKSEALDEKKQIALAASKFVEHHDTIMLMGSTISMLMIPLIKDKDITVVTNSLDIAKELSGISNIETIIIGGAVKNYKGNILGSRAIQELSTYHFDKAFIPCGGIKHQVGITTSTIDSADFLKTLISCSRKNIVVADYRKFGRVTFAKVCELNKIDTIITDVHADKGALHPIIREGITVEIAKK